MSEVKRAYADGGLPGLQEFVAFDHPHSAPVATGGRVADQRRLMQVRKAVVESLEDWPLTEPLGSKVAAFDLALGRALHEHLEIVPADAAHDETWSFLALMVFPDVVVQRFPDMATERLLGTPRNALRRTWFREDVLGDLQHSAKRPLGEDELVGLFERSALARNHFLVRRLAVAVLSYEGPARSAWAREVYKQVTLVTGARLLDALSDDELDDLIATAIKTVSGEPIQRAVHDVRGR